MKCRENLLKKVAISVKMTGNHQQALRVYKLCLKFRKQGQHQGMLSQASIFLKIANLHY